MFAVVVFSVQGLAESDGEDVHAIIIRFPALAKVLGHSQVLVRQLTKGLHTIFFDEAVKAIVAEAGIVGLDLVHQEGTLLKRFVVRGFAHARTIPVSM
jgi:hypothetical protein